MAIPPEKTGRPRNRAPGAAARLEAAEHSVALMNGQLAQLQLDADDGADGAAAALMNLRTQLATVRSELESRRAALELAQRLDHHDAVAARSKIRASQFAAFSQHMRTRDTAVAEICEAAKSMAAAFQKYGASTRQALAVKPIGTEISMMGMGSNGRLGPALGNLKHLIGVEMFRCAQPDLDGQRFVLPLVLPEDWHVAGSEAEIRPAIDVFREASAAILVDIKAQVESLDTADMASTTSVVAA